MQGVDLTTASRLLGHKDVTMTLRYSHLSPKHMTQAVDVLDNVLTGNISYTKLYNQEKGENDRAT
jgi:integrase